MMTNRIDANLIKNGTIGDWVVVNVPAKNVGDLISRQAAIDAIKRCDSADSYDLNNGLILAMNAVADVPTIDPVKHGEWITKKDACGIDYQICSNCETEIQWRNRHGVIMRVDMQNLPYCPNCGAMMGRSEG